MRRSIYCSASVSVSSRRRTELPIIYPDLWLDYKVATHPQKAPHGVDLTFLISVRSQSISRQPIKTYQRKVSRFVLQWLVPQAPRCVQWDFSFKGCTKAHTRLDSRIKRARDVGISFLPSLKIPHRSSLKFLMNAARSLTFRVCWSSDAWKRDFVDPN